MELSAFTVSFCQPFVKQREKKNINKVEEEKELTAWSKLTQVHPLSRFNRFRCNKCATQALQ